MIITPKNLLAGLAILLAVVAMIWPNHIILAVAVLLLGVAHFVP